LKNGYISAPAQKGESVRAAVDSAAMASAPPPETETEPAAPKVVFELPEPKLENIPLRERFSEATLLKMTDDERKAVAEAQQVERLAAYTLARETYKKNQEKLDLLKTLEPYVQDQETADFFLGMAERNDKVWSVLNSLLEDKIKGDTEQALHKRTLGDLEKSLGDALSSPNFSTKSALTETMRRFFPGSSDRRPEHAAAGTPATSTTTTSTAGAPAKFDSSIRQYRETFGSVVPKQQQPAAPTHHNVVPAMNTAPPMQPNDPVGTLQRMLEQVDSRASRTYVDALRKIPCHQNLDNIIQGALDPDYVPQLKRQRH